MTDQYQQWMDWTSGVPGAVEGDYLLSKTEIEEIVDAVMSTMGTLHTDAATIPTTATARPRGAFADPIDIRQYLDGGGLLTYDELGNPVPIPIVHILKMALPDSDVIIYEVWIDEQS